MISLSARAGVDIETIVDQLNSCGACPSYAARSATKHDTSPGSCCPVAVGNALMKMYREAQGKVSGEKLQEIAPKSHDASDRKTKGVCPVCGAALTHEGGCDICKNCGYSKCD
jgi:ribonucleoside-diphosphate reductase alpha chain